MSDALFAVALAALGAIVGSFLATIVVRWPQGRSAMRGRSACDGCDRTLGPAELVPLLSAALGAGRCRTCRARIDPRHWRMEAGCAAIGAVAAVVAPGLTGAAGAGFGWLLLTLAVLDLEHLWLPDALTGTLALGGVLAGACGLDPPLADRAIGGAAGFLSLWAVAAAYRRLRGREGMGGGDPKLFGAIGLWLGWRMLPVTLLIASCIGLAMVLIAIAAGRAPSRTQAMPFGTCLAAAAFLVWVAAA